MSPCVNDLGKSKYLKKEDVMKPVLVTIDGYEQVELENQGKKEKRWILTFSEDIKPLVLNKTNGSIIQSITGTGDFDGWTGVKIVLYNDPSISMGGKLTGGIRVRAPKNVASQFKGPDAAQLEKAREIARKITIPESEPDWDKINDEVAANAEAAKGEDDF